MKMLKLAIVAGAGVLLVSAQAAVAGISTYDFTFTSSGMDATGTITVNNGVAQSGSITVTGVPIENPVAGDPASLTLTGVPLIPTVGVDNVANHNGDVITFDNAVNPASNPVLTSNGLGFGSGQYDSWHYNTLVNLWGNSPGSYTLFVGEAGTHYGGAWDPEFVYAASTGTLTLTAVPEPTTMISGALALLLPVGVSVRRSLRKK